MECFSGDVNRMECGGVSVKLVRWWMGLEWVGWVGSGLSLVELGLGDCVWCVLLPEFVANATISSKSTPPVSHG